MAKRRGKGDPKVAVAYVRVSTDRQHLGPEAQRSAIEAWAAREGVRIARWHTDEGTSGSSELDDRPFLMVALADLKRTGAGLLVVARRDRLARSVEVAVAIERAVRQAGASVASADGRNDDDASSRLLRQIEDAVAEHERALISRRTKAALAAQLRRGHLPAGDPPFGFRRSGEGPPSKFSGRPLGLEPDPDEQIVCAEVMRLHDQGLSVKEIDKAVRFRLVGRTGHALCLRTIYRIIERAPLLRSIWPGHAGGLNPKDRRIACGRGHTGARGVPYTERELGQYCAAGECKDGIGNGEPIRRIDWRLPT